MRLLWVCCAFTIALKTALKIHREVVSGSSTQIIKIGLIANASISLEQKLRLYVRPECLKNVVLVKDLKKGTSITLTSFLYIFCTKCKMINVSFDISVEFLP